MPTDLTVTRLSTTPIKGLMLHHPDAIEVRAHGAVGDRQFYLVDETGKLQSCTRNPGLYGLSASWTPKERRLEVRRGDEVLAAGTVEDGAVVATDMFGLRTIEAEVVADPIWSTLFSDLVGRPVRLLRARQSAVDVRPVSLVGSASVAELARRSGVDAVDARRFRMLIEFSGGEPHDEDAWEGRQIVVGDAVLRAEGPVKRCAATTRHPETGDTDLQTLRLITDYRGRQASMLGVGANFGIYGDVLEPGRIAVGDRLEVGDDHAG
ncbi:MOSC domain-containing protein [Nocardioides sp. BGMRC 2183]|nr:MOSC domain-containing protein [Nocardioides sp. BGMRC 2183]